MSEDKTTKEKQMEDTFNNTYKTKRIKLSKLEDGAKDELKTQCPFHVEQTPSFYINIKDLTFHCFGCGASGTAAKHPKYFILNRTNK